MHTCVLSHLSCVRLFATHGPYPTRLLCPQGFSRQESRSGLLCPPPEDLPDPGMERTPLMSPAVAGGFLTTSASRETPRYRYTCTLESILLQIITDVE